MKLVFNDIRRSARLPGAMEVITVDWVDEMGKYHSRKHADVYFKHGIPGYLPHGSDSQLGQPIAFDLTITNPVLDVKPSLVQVFIFCRHQMQKIE